MEQVPAQFQLCCWRLFLSVQWVVADWNVKLVPRFWPSVYFQHVVWRIYVESKLKSSNYGIKLKKFHLP